MFANLAFFTASFLVGRFVIRKSKVELTSFVFLPASVVLGSVIVSLVLFGSGYIFPYTSLILYLIVFIISMLSIFGNVLVTDKAGPARLAKALAKRAARYSQTSFHTTRQVWRGQFMKARLGSLARVTRLDVFRSLRIWFIVIFLILLVVWLFGRSLFFSPEGGLIAGDRLVWVDWPIHIGIASNFAFGENVPPENPTFAGERLIYPFFADFVSGMLMGMGASLPQAFALPGIVLTLCFFWLFVGFVREIMRGIVEIGEVGAVKVGLTALVLSLFWGGLGWVFWLSELAEKGFNPQDILFPPREYSFWGEKGLWFFTFIFSEILPQRAFLFGLPMFFLVLLLIVKGLFEPRSKNFLHLTGPASRISPVSLQTRPPRRTQTSEDSTGVPLRESPVRQNLVLAGVLAGLMPFFHMHAFIALWIVSVSFVVLFGLLKLLKALKGKKQIVLIAYRLSLIAYFFLPFLFLSLLQAPLFLGKGGVIRFHLGWMSEGENIFLFWFKNTGLFIPLMLLGLLRVLKELKGKEKFVVVLGVASLSLFIIPNLFTFAPWGYDNLKLFTFWYLIGSIFVAYGLVRLGKWGWWGKLGAMLLFLSLTLTGFLEVGRLLQTQKTQIGMWKREDFVLAERIKEKTEPDSIFLTASIHDHPVVSLAGRKTIIGYPGNSWSWAIAGWDIREKDVHTMFRGGARAKELWKKYEIDYIIVSDRERWFERDLDERFISENTDLWFEQENTKVYKVKY